MGKGTGVNFAPYHNRPEDVEFFDDWDIEWIKYIDPNAGKVSEVHRVIPNVKWIFRKHSISENDKEKVKADPEGMGAAHASFWLNETFRMREEAQQNGLPFPEQEQLWYEGINEPQVWAGDDLSYDAALDIACRYNVAWSNAMKGIGFNAFLLQLNTGHPAPLIEGCGSYLLEGVYEQGLVPDYRGYERIWEVSVKNNHPVGFHEYFDHYGPMSKAMKGWNPFRAMNFPNGVKRMNTEVGLDELVSVGGLPHHKRGYKVFYHDNEGVYVGFLQEYHHLWQKHPDYLGFCIFMLDYGSNHWFTFDIDDCRSEIVRRVWLDMGSTVVPFPEDGKCGDGPTPPTQYSPDFERVIEFVLGQEAGYVNDPNDPGGETKWGISQRWNPEVDVVSLTRDGAKNIYWRKYWLPSGAEDVPEPADLVYFDWYVQNPVVARNYMNDNPDSNAVLWSGDRTDWYTQLTNWPHHGKGWTRRMADVQREIAKFYGD